MLRIRLQRVGRKNDPSFRIVVMPGHKDSQSGKFIEILGSYNARRGKPQVNTERVKHWLALGARASGTVHNILVKQKVIAGKTVNVLPKRKPVEKTATPEAKAEETRVGEKEVKSEEINTEEKEGQVAAVPVAESVPIAVE